MRTGKLTYLYSTGELFHDSWTPSADTPDKALECLERIARARRHILSSSVQIVQLKVPGSLTKRVSLTGTGGTQSNPRLAVTIRNGFYTTGLRLRGVPRELFYEQATPKGLQAFRAFSRVLNECGCVLTRDGEQVRIEELVPYTQATLRAASVKVATKNLLLKLLGGEEGQRFWDEVKKKRRGGKNEGDRSASVPLPIDSAQ